MMLRVKFAVWLIIYGVRLFSELLPESGRNLGRGDGMQLDTDVPN